MLEGRYEVEGFFYNPNIHPIGEFRKRLEAAKELARLMDMPALFCEEYDPRAFFNPLRADTGLFAAGTPKAERCGHCYAVRLDRTAREAKLKGFDFFSSSLLYSRYQNHEEIRVLGLAMQQRHGVPFFYGDFREGWREGIDESRRMGLYRQKYCGCIYSRMERGL